MFEKLKQNLYVFYSPNEGANSYLLVGKKTALIDTSLEKNTSDIASSLSTIGLSPSDINIILHTHGHADHFSADNIFKNAEIWMHSFDANYVNLKDLSFTQAAVFGTKTFPKIKFFFEDNELISLKPFSLRALFTPGHTRGSVCFRDEKNGFLFSGDTLFLGSAGRFDLQSGSRRDLVASIEKLRKLKFSLLLPGHGLIVKEKQQRIIENALKSISGESFI